MVTEGAVSEVLDASSCGSGPKLIAVSQSSTDTDAASSLVTDARPVAASTTRVRHAPTVYDRAGPVSNAIQ